MEEPTMKDIANALNTLNITLCRIYDVQMALLAGSNPAAYREVGEAHENGSFLGAPPMIGDDPFSLEQE